jgi:hypothetical protein
MQGTDSEVAVNCVASRIQTWPISYQQYFTISKGRVRTRIQRFQNAAAGIQINLTVNMMLLLRKRTESSLLAVGIGDYRVPQDLAPYI